MQQKEEEEDIKLLFRQEIYSGLLELGDPIFLTPSAGRYTLRSELDRWVKRMKNGAINVRLIVTNRISKEEKEV